MRRLHRRESRRGQADQVAGLATQVFQHRRILLLRHDAGRAGDAVRERQVAELRRRPDIKVLHHPAAGDHHDRQRSAQLQRKIPRRDAVQRTCQRAAEAQHRAGCVAVDRKRRAGQRAGSQRGRIRGFQHVQQAVDIP
ncbi:hypothetical protein G6F65_017188 [Rhizopus arrhizus]|nr:hypothetical protein G6F65_017188 [Rhizopus arrhizus]